MALSHREKIKLHSFLVCLNMQGNLKEIFFCRTLVMYKSPRFLVESSFYRWRNLRLREVSCPTTGQRKWQHQNLNGYPKSTPHTLSILLYCLQQVYHLNFFFWYLVNLSKKFTLCHLKQKIRNIRGFENYWINSSTELIVQSTSQVFRKFRDRSVSLGDGPR